MSNTQIKRLPRNEKGTDFARSFQANGNTYIIRTQKEGIGIKRYSMFQNFTSVWAFEADAGAQVKAWQSMVEKLDLYLRGKASLSQVYAIAKSATDGLNRTRATDYRYVFWCATLFIVREDEDLTQYVEEDQQKKIDDWNAEGYHEEDFDELVKKKVLEFSRALPTHSHSAQAQDTQAQSRSEGTK